MSTYVVTIDSDFLRREDITANGKTLYMVLRSYANTKGIAWPSQATLERQTMMEKRTVRRATKELISLGLVSIIQRSHGPKQGNTYRIFAPNRGQKRPTSTYQLAPSHFLSPCRRFRESVFANRITITHRNVPPPTAPPQRPQSYTITPARLTIATQDLPF